MGKVEPLGFREECVASLLPPICNATGNAKEACWVMLPLPWERITITNSLAAVKLDYAPANVWRAHYF